MDLLSKNGLVSYGLNPIFYGLRAVAILYVQLNG